MITIIIAVLFAFISRRFCMFCFKHCLRFLLLRLKIVGYMFWIAAAISRTIWIALAFQYHTFHFCGQTWASIYALVTVGTYKSKLSFVFCLLDCVPSRLHFCPFYSIGPIFVDDFFDKRMLSVSPLFHHLFDSPNLLLLIHINLIQGYVVILWAFIFIWPLFWLLLVFFVLHLFCWPILGFHCSNDFDEFLHLNGLFSFWIFNFDFFDYFLLIFRLFVIHFDLEIFFFRIDPGNEAYDWDSFLDVLVNLIRVFVEIVIIVHGNILSFIECIEFLPIPLLLDRQICAIVVSLFLTWIIAIPSPYFFLLLVDRSILLRVVVFLLLCLSSDPSDAYRLLISLALVPESSSLDLWNLLRHLRKSNTK